MNLLGCGAVLLLFASYNKNSLCCLKITPNRDALYGIKHEIYEQQRNFDRQRWADVRIIEDWDLLLVEQAIECPLANDIEVARRLACDLARRYVEKCDRRFGNGLIPTSAPFVNDIAQFWRKRYSATQKPH